MRNHAFLLPCALSLCAACIPFFGGGGAATPDASTVPPSAHVVLPELELDDGRLHATIWYDAMPAGAPLRAVLVGPSGEQAIDVPAEGSGACSRLSFTNRGGPLTSVTRAPQSPCSWAIETPSVGPWAIELRLEGNVLDRRELELLEVPALGGGRRWIVHPRVRVGSTYLHPAGYVTWVAVDVGVARRQHHLVELHDGIVSRQTVAEVEGPSPSGAGPVGPAAIDVVPLLLPIGTSSAHEQVVMLRTAGSETMSGWRFSIDYEEEPTRLAGIEVWRTQAGQGSDWERYFGLLAPTTLRPNETTVEPTTLRIEPRDERTACAWLESLEVVALQRRAAAQWEEMNTALRRAGEATDTLRRPQSYSPAERRNIARTRDEATREGEEARRAKAQTDAEIERLLARHAPGCLAAALPAL